MKKTSATLAGTTGAKVQRTVKETVQSDKGKRTGDDKRDKLN